MNTRFLPRQRSRENAKPERAETARVSAVPAAETKSPLPMKRKNGM